MKHWKLIVGVVVLVALLGGVAVVVLGNSLGETAAGDVRPGPGGSGATAIVMSDNSFEPSSVTVPAGEPAEIQITNAGQVNHNFTSEALHVSSGPVKPGEVVTMTVSVPSGTNQFLCTWHQGMAIQVTGS